MAAFSPSPAPPGVPPARNGSGPDHSGRSARGAGAAGRGARPGEQPSPPARRLVPPRWLDLRLVAGVVLVLAAVLIGAQVVSSADHRYATVAASRDLAAGTIVSADDVHLAKVQLPDRSLYASDVDAVVGKRLARAVTGGELVPTAALAVPSALTKLTIPLGASSAPQLQAGQRIEVWVSAPGCASTVLLPDVTVQAVRSDDSDTFGSGSGQDVVVDVAPAVAGSVVQALAIDQAQLRAGVLVGVGATAPASTGVPDLAACATTSPSR